MEFKPTRHTTPPKEDSSYDGPIRRTPVSTDKQTPSQPTHASQETRSFYGFDDIPVESDDMSNVRFIDIFKAWGKRAINHSPLEEKAGRQKKRFDNLKNDIKWAMQADLDEPVKPATKKTELPKPQPTMQQVTPPAQADASKTIDININFGSMPKLPNAKKGISSIFARIKSLRPKPSKLNLKIVGALTIVILGTTAWFFVPSSPGSIANNTPSAPSAGSKNSPNYATVLPGSKSVEDLGGWHRVSPDDRDPVYAYADKIGDVAINVSQQPLPGDFASDTSNKVSELAKAYGATNKVEAGSQMIYIGTSEKGPQSAIVVKNSTLILMKSIQKIPDEAWASYVKSLR